MQLADPMDDSTFTNENSVMSNWQVRIAGYNTTQEKWDKIFGKPRKRFEVQIVRKATSTRWIVLRSS